MKLSNNIASYEVLPKSIHDQFAGNQRALMRLIDPKLINAWQWFIGRHGTTGFNDWFWGGASHNRGLRLPNTVGATWSQHIFGRALDGVPRKKSVLDIHKDIITNPQLYTEAGFTCFECIWDAPTWIHGDVRWHNQSGLLFVDFSGNAYNLEQYKKELIQRGFI